MDHIVGNFLSLLLGKRLSMLLDNLVGSFLDLGRLQLVGKLFLHSQFSSFLAVLFGDFGLVMRLPFFPFFLLFGSLLGQNRLSLSFFGGLTSLLLPTFFIGDCFSLGLERCLLGENLLLLFSDKRHLSFQVDRLLGYSDCWLDDWGLSHGNLSLHCRLSDHHGSLGGHHGLRLRQTDCHLRTGLHHSRELRRNGLGDCRSKRLLVVD